MGVNKLRLMKYQEGGVSGRTGEYGEHAALVKALRAERETPKAKVEGAGKPVQKGLFD